MRLAVVVLNYNTRGLLRNCLRSVFAAGRRAAGKVALDVVVVDSASSDESAAMVAAEFPEGHLVASPVNLGYTGGNNLALQLLGFAVATPQIPNFPLPKGLCKPDFVILLNADTEVVDDALWTMIRALVERPSAGACGAHLRYGDGTFQHGAFRFPTLVQLAADLLPLNTMPGLRNVWGRLYNSPLNGRYPLANWGKHTPFVVDFVLGAALMVRAEAIDQVGGLDNDYFLYCEEMDWCLRLAEAGWATLAVPDALVIHHDAQSSRQVRWPAYERLWRSRLRFYQKHTRHYQPEYIRFVRMIVRIGMRWRAWLAMRNFAHGTLTGSEVAAELSAYEHIARL